MPATKRVSQLTYSCWVRSREFGTAVTAALLVGVVVAPQPVGAAGHHRVASVAWDQPGADGPASFRVQLASGGRTALRVRVVGGTVEAIPTGCEPSTVVQVRARIDADATTLTCPVDRGGETSLQVQVRPTSGSLGATVEEGGLSTALPALPVAAVRADSARTLRLLSSPDFLNADVGDLPRRPRGNGTNRAYERALDRVLDDWVSAAPDAVLVAGDLVNGRWDRDDRRARVFGPVRTRREQARAVRRAAATYYPQYLQRFRDHGLDLYPAIGDHEYGDDPWPAARRRLAPVYAREFARHFTRGRFADHPGGRHAGTAYAWRPSPDVQVVSIDPFDLTADRSRLRLDPAQQRWLVQVLRRAQADGVRWTIVQGHLPVLEPVRARGSSELRYAGGSRSRLWRTFEKYGVDLYLAGEVHDTTASERGGVVQLAHGGAFQFGLTTYALLDVHEDRIDVSLEDFDVRVGFSGERLWETAFGGLPASVRVSRGPFTIGTMSLDGAGGLTRRSGVLLPYHP